MFNRLIRSAAARVPSRWRWLVWAVLWPLSLPLRFVGWAASEMWGQLVGKAKSAFAPVLWPAFLLLFFVALFYGLGPDKVASVIAVLLVPVFLLIGAKMVITGRPPFSGAGKKKKKR